MLLYNTWSWLFLCQPELVSKLVVVDVSPQKTQLDLKKSQFPSYLLAMKDVRFDQTVSLARMRSYASMQLELTIQVYYIYRNNLHIIYIYQCWTRTNISVHCRPGTKTIAKELRLLASSDVVVSLAWVTATGHTLTHAIWYTLHYVRCDTNNL